jgi:thiol-disulfide isomerase/thioredoxin
MTKHQLLLITLLFFIAGILSSCQEKETLEDKPTIIAGKVIGFNDSIHKRQISFYYEDLVEGRITIATLIDKEGNFQFAFDIPHPTEFKIIYSGLLPYFISPGDSLHIEINSDCWSKTTSGITEELQFYNVTGKGSSLANEVSNYLAEFFDAINSDTVHLKVMRIANPPAYKMNCEKEYQNNLEYLNSYYKKHNSSEAFQKWSMAHIHYFKWYQLFHFRWSRHVFEPAKQEDFLKEFPDDFYKFIIEWEKNELSDLHSEYYHLFFEDYQRWFHSKTAYPNKNDEARISLKRLKWEKIQITQRREGFDRDLLLAKFYYRYLDLKQYPLISKIIDLEEILNPYLRQRVKEKFEYEKDMFVNPNFSTKMEFKSIDSRDSFMDTLIANHPNQILYIDFWAPWCKPCLREIEVIKTLKKDLEWMNIKYIYLANRCDSSAWKTTISERKIEGEHYLLPDSTFKFLKNQFDIQGIPHYLIVSKDGKILDGEAPSPSQSKALYGTLSEFADTSSIYL